MSEDTFASRLKALRIKSRLTQNELASELGIPRSNIANYETGASVPKYAQAKLLAWRLGVSTEYLLYGEEIYDPGLSTNANILLQTLPGCSEKEIATVIKVLESIKGTMPDD